MSTQAITGNINGVDVNALFDTIGEIRKNPDLAKFEFRAANRWIGGGLNRSEIKGFYGAGQENTTRREPYVFDADEPPMLLGEDRAANPVEYLLHSLGACLTTSMVYHAASRGIEIESLESRVEGDIDLRGFLGLDPNVPKGYREIRVRFTVKSDADAEKLALLAKFSPVFNSLTKPVKVVVDVRKV